jgi:predicted nucleic acid-binding protein
MIVLDTTAVVALQDRRDRWYAAALEAVTDEPGPFIVPIAVLAEVDAVLAGRSAGAMTHVLGSALDGSLLIDVGESDLSRIAGLMADATGLRLGFADAAVAACAERTGAPVLTFSPDGFEGLVRSGVITLTSSVV